MTRRFALTGGPLLLLVALASPGVAQQPNVIGKVDQRSAAGGLEAAVSALVASTPQPAWIGYAVPAVARSDRGGRGETSCTLELEARDSAATRTSSDAPAREPGSLIVLYRIDGGRIGRVRVASDDCRIDADGLPFHWLTGVRPAESVALLAGQVRASAAAAAVAEKPSDARSLARPQSALTAIALHADPAADRTLEAFVAAGQPASLRKNAAFWLGAARGAAGFEVLRRVVPDDPDAAFRREATLALSLNPAPDAIPLLVRLARQDKAPEVRGQALFWVAQKAGKKAAGSIAEAIENDPDTEVKRRAVFALSRLPADEGIPLLIKVARSNANPAVRKQACFWLGQSKDPRALAFFEEVLAGSHR